MLIEHNIYISQKEERREKEQKRLLLRDLNERRNHNHTRTRTFSAQRFKIRRTQRLGEGDAAVARIHVVEGGRRNGIDSRWGGGWMSVCALGDGECVSDGVCVSLVLVVS